MALLDGLDPAQRDAVTSEAAPLCILAAAGSGKTRVLTHRIAHRIAVGSAEARHVLALTFTRKAAGELQARLGSLGVGDGVTAGTFHAVAWAELRRHAADLGKHMPTLLPAPGRLVAPLLPGADPGSVDAVVGEIAWARARLVPPARYEEAAGAAGRSVGLAPAALAALYARYEADKRVRHLLDFDDLLSVYAETLEADSRFGEAQRWRFRHLFVDEFQDVNPLQFRLLRAWLGDRLDLCVVGDPDQAVYAWNGSDPELLHRFAEHFPTAAVVRLDRAYRCPPEVLAVAGAVLPGTGRVDGTDRPADTLPTVRAFPTDLAEATGIARALRSAHRPGTPWSDLAVLVRTNGQRETIERALRAAGIPQRWQAEDFRRAPEVRAALDLLRRTPPAVPFPSAVADLRAEGGHPVLLELAEEYARFDRTPSTAGFLAWLRLVVRGDEPGDGNGVTVTTFHRAKGLEWPVVFVAGLEWGLVPVAHAASAAATAEERRLLYVALTRATRELHCSWAEQRTMGGRHVRRRPSPWLPALEQACARLAVAGDRRAVGGRAQLAAARARLAAVDADTASVRRTAATARRSARNRRPRMAP